MSKNWLETVFDKTPFALRWAVACLIFQCAIYLSIAPVMLVGSMTGTGMTFSNYVAVTGSLLVSTTLGAVIGGALNARHYGDKRWFTAAMSLAGAVAGLVWGGVVSTFREGAPQPNFVAVAVVVGGFAGCIFAAAILLLIQTSSSDA